MINSPLSSIQKSIFQSISRTQSQVDRVQLALATGKDVNTALDNPQSFFTALSLSNRASDLLRTLDGIGQSIRTVQGAASGVESISQLLDQAEALTNEARLDATITGDILNQIVGLDTGTYNAEVDGTNQTVYVDFDGTDYWLLVGRGREGWEFDTDGQGDPNDVVEGLGTRAAFDPVAYSDDFVNRIIGQTEDVDLLDVDIRIKRAANIEGTEFQDVFWNSVSQTEFTFAFSENGQRFAGFEISHETSDSVLGTGTFDPNSETSDTFGPPGPIIVGNDHNRVFTWDWPSANNQAGFAYGATVDSFGTDDPDNFLWEFFPNVDHAVPYSEVYIKLENPTGQSQAAAERIIAQSKFYTEQYQEVINQIDTLTTDANYRGINLLRSENLLTIFNEDGSSVLLTEGIDATSTGLGLATEDLSNRNRIDDILREIRGAKESLRSFGSTLQTDFAVITVRQTFTEETINTLSSASDDLTVTDQNKTGAEFLALQVRQQVQFQTLALNSQIESVNTLFA